MSNDNNLMLKSQAFGALLLFKSEIEVNRWAHSTAVPVYLLNLVNLLD